MKFFLTLSIVFLFSLYTNAQDWTYDIEQAKEIASSQNKTVILVFQGSDWCGPCIKLDKSIWQSEEFKNYAKDHYVMLKADFPRKKANKLSDEQKAKNQKLAERYNTAGYFPFVVVLDKDGNVLRQTGYKKVSPDEYIKILNGE